MLKVLNEKKESVQINWDEECLVDEYEIITDQQLKLEKWNLKKFGAGALRQYLTK